MGRRRQTEPPVPPSFLREAFAIRDGVLIWRERPASHFPNRRADHQHFNSLFAGKPAGFRESKCFPMVRVQYSGCTRRLAILRVAWAVATGELPRGVVAARDGDPWNASAENLIVVKAGPRPFTQSKGGRGSALIHRGEGERALIDKLAESQGSMTVPQLSVSVGQSAPCCCFRLAALARKGLVCGPACNARKRWDLTPAGLALAASNRPVLDVRDYDILSALAVIGMGRKKLSRWIGVSPMMIRRRTSVLIERGLVVADPRGFFALTIDGRAALGYVPSSKPVEPWVKPAAISAASSRDVAHRLQFRAYDDRSSAMKARHASLARQRAVEEARRNGNATFNRSDEWSMTG